MGKVSEVNSSTGIHYWSYHSGPLQQRKKIIYYGAAQFVFFNCYLIMCIIFIYLLIYCLLTEN